jgi:FlaA1/EpsC-like NDP-sugar epimerase
VSNRFSARHVIIALPSANLQERRKILNLVHELELKALTVPAIEDLISGRLNISQIRRVDVEDLLGRDAVELDNSGLQRLIGQQSVLISGAGGSIGSELCRQIIKFNPSHLICFDISEYALYELEQEFSSQRISTKIIFVVGDVKNVVRLDGLLKRYDPKIVFHAAAYKHVPLMENENASEALNNNVLGTFILAQACKRAKIEKFILISTDKAVNPTNVMGATKRLAEMVCQGLQDKKGTRFVIVRFGNVLGSSGSVIPKFHKQINAGGPITVTHPEVTRYFMSIPEAAQLVMQAGLMGNGGEIFVLNMGEPIRIADLAKDMIKFSGFSEDEIKIEFSGLRAGEKLYEELLTDNELTLTTSHEKLRIASSKSVDEKWVNSLLKWVATTTEKNERLVKEELKGWLEEYQGDVNAQ